MAQFPHKIVVPQRQPYLVSRPRLTDLLRTIVDRRLITLSAPAGYGKTSLLTDFASDSPPLPICWYTLDRFDEDPWVFLGYLQAAIEQVFPGATQQTAALLASGSRNPFTTAAAGLVRELYAIQRDVAIVLDDWHLVDHVADITQLIAQFLLQCPNVRLILASRIYPSLPDMMLLAARRQMSGLDEEHLRFTPHEISAVLGAEYHTEIQEEQARTLAEQSNGWITGVLLAMHGTGPGTPSIAPADTRAERQIYRFLAEQVFDREPAEVRPFLLQASLLEELTTETCDAVFERGDSGLLLQTLQRHHLFVSEIKPGVLRFHPLFREFLQEHFRVADPRGYHDTALRVADAYAAQGSWPLAFEICIAAGDHAAARRVVAGGGEQLITEGRLETVERWFAALPLDELDAPLLCLKARLLLDRGHSHEAQALANLAEARMRPDEAATVTLLQAHIARLGGEYRQAIEIVRRVIERGPGGKQAAKPNAAERAAALRTSAICRYRLGQATRAVAELEEALALERQRGDLYATALLQQDLGLCYEDAGQLHRAADCFSHADAHWAMIGNTGMRSVSLNCKGVAQHSMGHYRDAHATLAQALEHAEAASVPGYQATALVSLGDLYSDLQLWGRAAGAYDEARKLGGSAFLLSYLDLAEVRLLLRQRQRDRAARALQRLSEATRKAHAIAVELLEGSAACYLGDYPRGARAARAALEALGPAGKPMDLARAYLLQAHAAASAAPGSSECVVSALERAAQIADRLGRDAFLVAETQHMGSLLRRAYAAGWVRAADWLQRHQEMQLVAQQLRHDDSRPLLVARTLGLDQLTRDGHPLDLGWLKAREVFYYLLHHPEGATPDALREAIWPDLGREGSRNALKTAIYQLRCSTPRELIALHGRQVYVLNRDVAEIDYDVERFVRMIEPATLDGEALFDALELYRGPFLPWSDNGWAVAVRMDLEQRYLRALRDAALAHERAGAYLDALMLHRKLLAVDVLDEAAHAGVMRCQIAVGNRAAAIEQYQALRRILDEELGLELGRASEAEQLYYSILAAT